MSTDIDASDAAKDSTIHFKPIKLNPEDVDLTHYIDVFELIKDLVRHNKEAKNED